MRTWLQDNHPWDEAKVMDDLDGYLRDTEEGRPPEPRVLDFLRECWRENARQADRLFEVRA